MPQQTPAVPPRAVPARVDFGRRVIRYRGLGVAVRMPARGLVVGAVVGVLTLLVTYAALAYGTNTFGPGTVLRALTADDGGTARTIVFEWRAPRAVAAVFFGAALGVSGAIFQSLTRNPLASPDIIGFSAGSYTGALMVMILFSGAHLHVAAGALAGGLATAAVVYVLSYRRGVRGFRLIIVGIGITAMLGSFNTWLILTSDLQVAMSAAFWGAGSLAAVTWPQAVAGSSAIIMLLMIMIALARPMAQLELGDDAARSHGVRVEPARLALIVVGVALTASVTAAAGPIAFVALVAPQIARRIVGSEGIPVLPTAVVGAFLLAVADFAGQNLFPHTLPVGVVTVVFGGGYLVWLLIREARRHAAGR